MAMTSSRHYGSPELVWIVKTFALGKAAGVCIVAVVVSSGGCASGPAPVMRDNLSPTALPCLESCGGDRACKAQCQPLGNGRPPPPGILYQR